MKEASKWRPRDRAFQAEGQRPWGGCSQWVQGTGQRPKVPWAKWVRGRRVGHRVREPAGPGHGKPCKSVRTLAFSRVKWGDFFLGFEQIKWQDWLRFLKDWSNCYAESKLLRMRLEEGRLRDFPGGLVVKTLPSKAGGVGLIPSWEAKIPHTSQPKNQNLRQ